MKLDHTTLRAIGQDLETIGLFDFDLKLEGEKCVVRGEVASPDSTEPPHPSRSFKALWGQLWGPKSERGPKPVERVYLSDDIDRLVGEAQSRRGKEQARPRKAHKPERYSTGEILRVFAFYCETAELQPVSVSKQWKQLKCEYLTKSGAREQEERPFSELVDFARGMSLKRDKG